MRPLKLVVRFQQMQYSDGSEILTGDAVLIEQGKTEGKIVAVVEQDRVAEFNVGEAGLMIEAAPFGLVYVPASMFEGQGISLNHVG